jgi:magnesium chelatase family protein
MGIEAPEVSVEVHLAGGLPKLSIVGMPEIAVRESKDRVRAALLNAGFDFPARRITISLAPADLPKDGGRFDLPIALGVLAASGQVASGRLKNCEFIGELALNGNLRSIRGMLPVAARAWARSRTLVLPVDNGAEAALVADGDQLCAASLLEVVAWMNGEAELQPPRVHIPGSKEPIPDLRDVIGQHRARRALEIAATGGHNLLMAGPPGTGKTMLAIRLPGIMPQMSTEEALETASVASISQLGLNLDYWRRRPFRAPHHTCSGVALAGGSSRPRPGEISLAHNGVLFLDELPEFDRHALEVLREPMESGRIVISRAARQAEFPARFQLIAAMNPCPCGYHGDRAGQCHCSAEQIYRYRSRISGPLLDRIDLQVEVSRPKTSLLEPISPGNENSVTVRRRVVDARNRQLQKYGKPAAFIPAAKLLHHCQLSHDNRNFLETAANKLALSPRGIHRVLRLSRTIADLAAENRIGEGHLAEAIAFRQLTRRIPV